MSCYHPLRGIVLGTNENGKKNIKIIKGSDFEFQYPDVEYLEIPCGHCIGCLLDRSRQWADRCMLEAKTQKDKYNRPSCFITLTYDDEHLKDLPYNPDMYPDYDPDRDTDKLVFHSLDKIHLQNFWKRLRSRLDEKYDIKIRYFACGEYGDFEKTGRPHFHAIIFGYDFNH